jgi:protein O-mannosyl-transferase
LLLGYAAAVLCALLSNEWGVLALPLTALIIYVDGLKDRSVWLSLCLCGMGVFALQLVMRRFAGARLPTGSLEVMPVGLSFFKYLSWIISPIHMSVERSTDAANNEITTKSIAALVGVGCVLFLIFKLRSGAPRIAAGLTWVLICLLPFSGIVFIYQGMAERYAYLASAGLVFSVVALSDHMRGSIRPLFVLVISLWVLWNGWRLNARVLEWGNETTLFQSSLKVNPRSEVLLYNLAIASAEAGNVQEATSYYQRALDVNPSDLNVLVNFGNLLRDQGDYTAALTLQERAIRVGPNNAELWVNLGDTYLKQGTADKAIEAFRKAVSLDEKSIEASVGLGAALQSTGKLAAAKEQYQRAIAIDPHQGAAYCNLGALLLKEGNTAGAINQFKGAITADASYYPAYFDLGLVYESSGRNAEAISIFEKALQVKPNDANALMHLRRLQAR